MYTIVDLKLSLLIAEIKPDYLFMIFPYMKYRYDINYAMESLDIIVDTLDDAAKVKRYFEEHKFRASISQHDSLLEEHTSDHYYVVRIELPEYVPIQYLSQIT